MTTTRAYSRLAALVASHHDFAIFRRFLVPYARNLLFLQAEIVYLEVDLQIKMRFDRNSEIANQQRFDEYYRLLRESGTAGSSRAQLEQLQHLNTKLQEYGQAMLLFRKILNLSPVNSHDIKCFRDWLADFEGGDNFLHGNEALVWDTDVEYDLTSLSATRANQDSFTLWVEDIVLKYYHRVFGSLYKKRGQIPVPTGGFESTPTHVYSEKSVRAMISSINTVLASTLPIVSIFALYSTHDPLVRLLLIAVFSFLFATTISFVSGAKRVDCFSASAAFAAVQVVFISSTNATTGGAYTS